MTEEDRGVIRAFLFDHLWKLLIMLIDDIVNNAEKGSSEKVSRALHKINVSLITLHKYNLE